MEVLKRCLGIALIIVMMVSCGKYEDGPAFSLRTKKSRLTGDWKFVTLNDSEALVESEGEFIRYWSNCGAEYANYHRIIEKENMIWEIEGDHDVKEKYFGITYEFNYGQSYTQPDCAPVYNLVDSANTVVVKRWSFRENKKDLRIDYNNRTIEYEILELTNSNLKLMNDYGDVYYFEKLD